MTANRDTIRSRAERLVTRLRDLGFDPHADIVRDLLSALTEAEQAREAAERKLEIATNIIQANRNEADKSWPPLPERS